MPISELTRRWMQDFAAVRNAAVKIRNCGDRVHGEELDLVDRAIGLAETVRKEAASLHQRCMSLEKQFKRTAARVDELFERLPAAVVLTDVPGAIIRVNPAAATLLGRGALILRNQLLLHYSDDREAFAEILRQLPELEDRLTVVTRFRPRDRAPFQANVTVLADPRDETGKQRLWFLYPIPTTQPAMAKRYRAGR